MSKIDTATETKIVALLARGDTLQQVKDFLADQGTELSISGIQAVKNRNTEALSYVKNKLMEHNTSNSARILDKARKQLEQKLDNSDKSQIEIDKLQEMYNDGEIDAKELLRRSDEVRRRYNINVKDLTTISKEMFNQSQVEAGKPTSITENPAQQKENLRTLLDAINKGDEAAIANAIFLDV